MDTIEYVKNPQLGQLQKVGDPPPAVTFTKTVTSVTQVTDIDSEIKALQAQLAAFTSSQDTAVIADVAAAIQNYQDQLAVLQS